MPQELLDTRDEKISDVILGEEKDFFQQAVERFKSQKSHFFSRFFKKLKIKLNRKKSKSKSIDKE